MRVRAVSKSQAAPISPFAACAILVKWDEKINFKNPGLRVARAVGRTPFGNKNLINNELGCKPAFENFE